MQRSLTVLAVTGAVLVCAVSACSGGKSSSSGGRTTTTATAAKNSPAASPSAAMSTKTTGSSNAMGAHGATIFNTNCSSCHQANGKGSMGVFPPLAGNAVVEGDASKVIHIVKNGLTGSIKVNGTTYNGTMPPWKATLSNAEIAGVITYIRSSWGNHASAVTTSQVASTP